MLLRQAAVVARSQQLSLKLCCFFGVSGPCDVRSGTPCQAGFGGELWAKRKRKASSHQYLKG